MAHERAADERQSPAHSYLHSSSPHANASTRWTRGPQGHLRPSTTRTAPAKGPGPCLTWAGNGWRVRSEAAPGYRWSHGEKHQRTQSHAAVAVTRILQVLFLLEPKGDIGRDAQGHCLVVSDIADYSGRPHLEARRRHEGVSPPMA